MNSSLINCINVLDGMKLQISGLDRKIKIDFAKKCNFLEADSIESAQAFDFYGQIYKKNNIVMYSKMNDIPCYFCVSNLLFYKVGVNYNKLNNFSNFIRAKFMYLVLNTKLDAFQSTFRRMN